MGITRDWISYFRAGAILTLTPSLRPATSSCWTRPTTKPCSCTRLSIKQQAFDTKLWIGQCAGAYGRYHLSGTNTVYHEAVCLHQQFTVIERSSQALYELGRLVTMHTQFLAWFTRNDVFLLSKIQDGVNSIKPDRSGDFDSWRYILVKLKCRENQRPDFFVALKEMQLRERPSRSNGRVPPGSRRDQV